jgi:hypothetical protein
MALSNYAVTSSGVGAEAEEVPPLSCKQAVVVTASSPCSLLTSVLLRLDLVRDLTALGQSDFFFVVQQDGLQLGANGSRAVCPFPRLGR